MKPVLKMTLLAATVLLAVGCNDEKAQEAAPAPAAKVEQTAAKTTDAASAEKAAFASEDDQAAYAIGASLAKYLNANLDKQAEIGLDLKKEMVLEGVKDAFNNTTKLTDQELQDTLKSLDTRVAKLAQEKAAAAAQAAVKAGDDFRADFAKQEGVKTTDSGLMYKVETMGTGAKPKATDTVEVHYTGTLIDGTKFDSSYDRNQPATFPLNRVIPGWTEGVQLMPVGSKFKFVIPPQLAYGEQDSPAIPANSTLVFEVELLKIGQPAQAAAK
ncbi:FKBP-type peptidyl-prolyl cis-trans isomerase [Vibrio sp. SS-MA-C1-2]|uniref:FKBP-type peptidyl-prolyl cis-trans isomerase n=1 Tax=Vibrio sp. SS-MA-C1-2 TaxID=2908646 RepID=UPI001F218F0F|nr:FKBP-type peptidyl-prolyl cis-trans isomerase [Vibrio sp. SS-MA-C1-2]UJF19203.1 FKBP-type peptidyl-prolyl cis-trans isomerase [Vibrio sp. SS-MA-C1-2]